MHTDFEELLKHIWVAIIAGGQGTRLFPLSYEDCPKQFCRLNDKHTFIQDTIIRFTAVGAKASRIVIITTNDRQTELAKQQTAKLGVITPNIYQINPEFGYAGAMIKAAAFIKKQDSKAIIINTPADQYVKIGNNFISTMQSAIECANNGIPSIIGVKEYDLTTFMGCGHATFDPNESSHCKTVKGFIEKPDKETAIAMMRQENSACNTGINVWRAVDLIDITKGRKIKGIGTDTLMAHFKGNLKLAVGEFEWHDCGTLKSLYAVSPKTPNHKNASIGEVTRYKCLNSLFVTIDGVRLHASGIHNEAIVINQIGGNYVVVSAKLDDSQKVRRLAEDYQANKDFLTDDFSVGAHGNDVMFSNLSHELRCGFIGVNHHFVHGVQQFDGTVDIYVSDQYYGEKSAKN